MNTEVLEEAVRLAEAATERGHVALPHGFEARFYGELARRALDVERRLAALEVKAR